MRKDENENGVGEFGDHTTPFSATPINITNDGDTFMDSTNVSTASTEKAPRGISQVDYEALDNIDALQEEIVECEVEELEFSDSFVDDVVQELEAEDTWVEAAAQPKINKVENLALATGNTGSIEAKPPTEIAKKEDGTVVIPPELLNEMNAAAGRIRDLHDKSVKNLVAIGRDLIAMKSVLKHGQFTKWYEHEFGWNGTTVKRYMDGARGWDEIVKLEPEAKVEILPHTLLYTFGKLSETQQLEIAQAAKTGNHVKADDYKKKASVPASSRNDAEALAKLIASSLQIRDAMTIANKPGFDAPVFGKLLKKAISNSFGF